jgi:hypothetical protein
MSATQTTKVYKWEGSERYPDRLHGTYQDEEKAAEYLYKLGSGISTLIDSPLEFIFFAPASALLKYDYLENDLSVPFVSPLVAKILKERCANAIQLFDARANCRGGEIVTDYKVVNVLKRMAMVDLERSEYVFITSKVRSFTKLVLLPHAMGSEEIARMDERPSHLLVSANLRQALLDAGARHLSFSQLETSQV